MINNFHKTQKTIQSRIITDVFQYYMSIPEYKCSTILNAFTDVILS